MEMSLLRSRTLAPLPLTPRPVSAQRRRRRRLPSVTFFPPQPPPPSRGDRACSSAMRQRQEWVGDWVRSNDTLVRALPILVGGASLLAVLLNRAVSGIAAVSDASSSQSRADILTLALSVTDILAGLVWLSIRPKTISPVVPRGVDCKPVDADVSSSALRELLWTWDSLTAATCCKSLVVVYGGNCKLQIGVAAASPEDGNAVNVDAQKFMQGSLYKSAMESKKRECRLLFRSFYVCF
uniref:Protein COFACTOR ASSEMBLY OF COMPLEX C SUBUNIT B CCB4, chloroplastic n=1 Tax=Aegilops tauschii subsp. strangulata TaxID=200361 RepID=A0A453D7Z8_AEGTS